MVSLSDRQGHSRVVLACDPAQRQDFSAIALVEELLPPLPPTLWAAPYSPEVHGADWVRVPGRPQDSQHMLRLLERSQGQTFKAMAYRMAEIAVRLRHARPELPLAVVVDSTGLGLPFLELVQGEFRSAGVSSPIAGCQFVHGTTLRGRLADRDLSITLGKEALVSAFVGLMEHDRIHFPADHPLAGVLRQELADYHVKLRKSDGLAQFGAFGAGQHDDLVTAVALATVLPWKPPTMVRGYA